MDQQNLPDEVPEFVGPHGPQVLRATMSVTLYQDNHLSVVLGRLDRATRKMTFEQVFMGPAPPDLNRQPSCVLWYGAQVVDDQFHSPW